MEPIELSVLEHIALETAARHVDLLVEEKMKTYIPLTHILANKICN